MCAWQRILGLEDGVKPERRKVGDVRARMIATNALRGSMKAFQSL